jgi:hypothetical protein
MMLWCALPLVAALDGCVAHHPTEHRIATALRNDAGNLEIVFKNRSSEVLSFEYQLKTPHQHGDTPETEPEAFIGVIYNLHPKEERQVAALDSAIFTRVTIRKITVGAMPLKDLTQRYRPDVLSPVTRANAYPTRPHSPAATRGTPKQSENILPVNPDPLGTNDSTEARAIR